MGTRRLLKGRNLTKYQKIIIVMKGYIKKAKVFSSTGTIRNFYFYLRHYLRRKKQLLCTDREMI